MSETNSRNSSYFDTSHRNTRVLNNFSDVDLQITFNLLIEGAFFYLRTTTQGWQNTVIGYDTSEMGTFEQPMEGPFSQPDSNPLVSGLGRAFTIADMVDHLTRNSQYFSASTVYPDFAAEIIRGSINRRLIAGDFEGNQIGAGNLSDGSYVTGIGDNFMIGDGFFTGSNNDMFNVLLNVVARVESDVVRDGLFV